LVLTARAAGGTGACPFGLPAGGSSFADGGGPTVVGGLGEADAAGAAAAGAAEADTASAEPAAPASGPLAVLAGRAWAAGLTAALGAAAQAEATAPQATTARMTLELPGSRMAHHASRLPGAVRQNSLS
jgi:hypothetical protein